MQAAPARYVSVSELYSTDEVELLLDEIRELEPTSCRGEDVQDFEIAGSGFGGFGGAAGGGAGAGGAGAGAGGGRSPAGTDATERSWDSHAHYSRAPPPRPRALAPLYCRLRHLLTPGGAGAALVALASLAACACVWAVAGVRLWRLPLAGRVRLLALGALSAALLHAALLAAHVTRLAALLPLRWDRLALATAAWSCAALTAGAAATAHAVLAAPEYRWAPPRIAALLLAAAALGLAAAAAAAAIVCCEGRGWLAARRRRAGPQPPPPPRAAYRAVPAAPPPPPPPPQPQPSTSRDDPL